MCAGLPRRALRRARGPSPTGTTRSPSNSNSNTYSNSNGNGNSNSDSNSNSNSNRRSPAARRRGALQGLRPRTARGGVRFCHPDPITTTTNNYK